MTSSTKTAISVESRRDARAPLLATALVAKEREPLGLFKVVNISAGGALLAGRLDLPAGTTLDITVRLPWVPAMRTQALLSRVQNSQDEGSFAVQFTALAPHEAETIHSAVVHLFRKARGARVLVVTDQEIQVCHSFVLAIEDLGCSALAVTSTAEASRLLEAESAIRVVILDERLRHGSGSDWLVYLARRHPRIRRVLLSEAPTDPSSCSPIGLHAVLANPCTATALAAALSLP